MQVNEMWHVNAGIALQLLSVPLELVFPYKAFIGGILFSHTNDTWPFVGKCPEISVIHIWSHLLAS